jgi:hypothetical protein
MNISKLLEVMLILGEEKEEVVVVAVDAQSSLDSIRFSDSTDDFEDLDFTLDDNCSDFLCCC